MHSLVNRIFNREIQRPSEAKLWHRPAFTVFPIPCPSFFREEPLELQDTSYFAASASIFNFSITDICGAIRSSMTISYRAPARSISRMLRILLRGFTQWHFSIKQAEHLFVLVSYHISLRIAIVFRTFVLLKILCEAALFIGKGEQGRKNDHVYHNDTDIVRLKLHGIYLAEHDTDLL